jgi:hypothetical protein
MRSIDTQSNDVDHGTGHGSGLLCERERSSGSLS